MGRDAVPATYKSTQEGSTKGEKVMRRDVTYSHSKNIGEVLGDFHGVPVQAYDTFDLELDEALDVQQTVLCNQVMGCSDVPNTAEVLPGEVLCADNMIRRTTTAEASGYDEFKEKNPVKMLVGMDLMYDSEDRVWRNPNEWVRLGNGDLIRKQHGQMPAEKLCAWLNDPNNMKKRSFKSRIEVEGDDKLVITDDAKGNPVHAFRYIGGTPGTYIGGDETRLLEPPQDKCAAHSPSHVIQYFDNGNAVKKNENYVYREYADEFICTYVPTSHVERITVGGTALFTEQEEMV